MYAIPIHALRFAAHCRARLRLSESGTAEISCGSARRAAVAGVARFWVRFASHDARSDGPSTCSFRRVSQVSS